MADSTTAASLVSQTGMTVGDWAAISTAIGTLLLASIAILGERILRWVYRPKLLLNLKNDAGSLTKYNAGFEDTERYGRHYHLVVSNKARLFPFHNVSARFLALEKWGPGDRWHQVWEGLVPLRWRHEEPIVQIDLMERYHIPYQTKAVGPAWDVDLFSISGGDTPRLPELIIQPYVAPNSLKSAWVRQEGDPPVKLRLTLQAVANEGDSKLLRVVVEWDGKWDSGETEMAKHISIQSEN